MCASGGKVLRGESVDTSGCAIESSGAGGFSWGTFTLNGVIDGAGSISTVNTGNLVLNGNNAFRNLGIGAGTVTVGTNTAAGIGAALSCPIPRASPSGFWSTKSAPSPPSPISSRVRRALSVFRRKRRLSKSAASARTAAKPILDGNKSGEPQPAA